LGKLPRIYKTPHALFHFFRSFILLIRDSQPTVQDRMMNRLSLSLFPLLLATLAVGPTALFGQPRLSSGAPQASSGREALKLLDEALADAQALKLAENRLWAQSLAVAALWPHDERLGRAPCSPR
jgi:hypothetical protein